MIAEHLTPNVNEKPKQADADAPPLNPEDVRIFYDHKGFLRATVGNQTYLEVTIVRAFPLSHPDTYLGLLSGRRDEIGIIQDPTELDEESQRAIENELARRYFPTVISRVDSVREEFGATYWEVDTDRGPRRFVAKGLRDNVTYLTATRILINDVDGNRYEISDLSALDANSRALILRVI